MNKKTQYILTLLILFLFVTIPYSSNIKGEFHEAYDIKKNDKTTLNNNSKIIVYYSGTDGTFFRQTKTLSQQVYSSLIQTLSNISNLELSLESLFEKKLQILKDFNIIPDDITLSDILFTSKIAENSFNNFSLTYAHKFRSHFAPVFIAGMGFGLGFGFRRMPVKQHIAGNLFSIGLIGLGAVVCLDIENASLYYQFTFTYPYLIHILSGFVGVMLFAFDSIYPPKDGPPFTIYSNFFALGMAGLAIGFEFPPVE